MGTPRHQRFVDSLQKQSPEEEEEKLRVAWTKALEAAEAKQMALVSERQGVLASLKARPVAKTIRPGCRASPTYY